MAWPARTSRSISGETAALLERGREERPGIPERARGMSGRGGGGLGRTRVFRDGGAVWFVLSGISEGVGESGVDGSKGADAQAMASSMSSSSRSQETLMQRPTRRTVVSSGWEKWLWVASARRKRAFRSCSRL